MPLATSDFELKLPSGTAKETAHLCVYDDHRRAQPFLVLAIAQTVISHRSGLLTTIVLNAEEDLLRQVMARPEAAVNERTFNLFFTLAQELPGCIAREERSKQGQRILLDEFLCCKSRLEAQSSDIGERPAPLASVAHHANRRVDLAHSANHHIPSRPMKTKGRGIRRDEPRQQDTVDQQRRPRLRLKLVLPRI